MVGTANRALDFGLLRTFSAYQMLDSGMVSFDVLQKLFLESQMATVMSGSASDRLRAMLCVAAVPELVTIQADQQYIDLLVIAHHPRVVTIAAFLFTTPRTCQHLFAMIALPA